MLLKTKFQNENFDLGEEVEANIYYGGNDTYKIMTRTTKGKINTFYFKTLKELNKMFEDYEEPKGIVKVERSIAPTCVHIEYSTEEEAEKAVQKLQAWKRLKDKGIKLYGWRRNHTGTHDFLSRWEGIPPKMHEIIDDLDLLFCTGGEE